MDFKLWIEKEMLGLQSPGRGDYAKAAAGIGKAALGFVPIVGGAVGAAWDTYEAAKNIYQLRQQGKDITGILNKLMKTRDTSPGIPANAFDLADPIDALISDNTRMEIVKRLTAEIDRIIATGKNTLPSETANIIAIKHISRIINPLANQIRSQQTTQARKP